MEINKKVGNSKLLIASVNKRDEFYTQMEDIMNEVDNYKEHFKNKIVYCNCDDPLKSSFVKYFYDNFENFELKKLIASCYVENNTNLFNLDKAIDKKATYLEYTGFGSIADNVFELKGDGDFRGSESTSLLRQADIIVTNPPFSLFNEYVSYSLTFCV